MRQRVSLDGPPEQRGGVKGPFPFDGGYGAFEFRNWAAKFTIDANLFEQQLDDSRPPCNRDLMAEGGHDFAIGFGRFSIPYG